MKESSGPASFPAITLAWPGVQGAIHSRAPVIAGKTAPLSWRPGRSVYYPHRLGGLAGNLRVQTFTGGDLRVVRSVWRADAAEMLAVRLRVENRGRKSREIIRLTPVAFSGSGSLKLDGKPAGEWTALLQKRDKNEVPGVHRLGIFGDHQTVSEIGEVSAERESGPLRLQADPFLLLQAADGGAPLLAGFLSQQDAILNLRLETDTKRTALRRLYLDCEMDGVSLPPGGVRSSEWAVLMRGGNPARLTQKYAERVAAYHQVKPPPDRPPAVWCSWYVYGNEFGEKEFRAEIDAMTAARVPFDVFLIDDFRPRAWGDWFDCRDWPAGLKDAADRIRTAGYRPGFWTCPYVIERGSKFARAHPEWMLRRRDGKHVLFTGQRTTPRPRPNPDDPQGEPLFTIKYDTFYVLDPTFPGVEDYLEQCYRRLTHDYGFTYHKFDFMRAVFQEADAMFYDRSSTRLQAYRRGLAAIRRGAGPGAYLAVCGGHYGGSMGIADAQRSGADVRSRWDRPPVEPKIRQNFLRAWMNRFWHTDADAMMVRYQPRPLKRTFGGRHTIGLFTIDEARTMAANQYVGGGMLCGSEPMKTITPERLELYRHVIPVLRAPGVPLDVFREGTPTNMLNRIQPWCDTLDPWLTVTVFNWRDRSAATVLRLDADITAHLPAERYLAAEFFTGHCAGVVAPGVTLGAEMAIPPHGCRIWRLAPWNGKGPVLAGTDRHFSGGGVEVREWQAGMKQVRCRVESPWPGSMRIRVAFPRGKGCTLADTAITPGQWARINRHEGSHRQQLNEQQ